MKRSPYGRAVEPGELFRLHFGVVSDGGGRGERFGVPIIASLKQFSRAIEYADVCEAAGSRAYGAVVGVGPLHGSHKGLEGAEGSMDGLTIGVKTASGQKKT